jgi:carbonic anhydrase
MEDLLAGNARYAERFDGGGLAAGGRVTDDVVRSLIVSVEILGTRSVAVIQHTDCGMAKTTDDELKALVRERRGADPGPVEFLTIDDHADAIRADVAILRESPLLPSGLEVRGYLYDVRTGRLTLI